MKQTFAVDRYFHAVPKTKNATLFVLRELIFDLFPNIVETIHFGMPTYTLDGYKICALADDNSYMTLHIMPHDLLMEFEYDLQYFNWQRSKIQFTTIDRDSFELFEKIIHFVGTNYHKSGVSHDVSVKNNNTVFMENVIIQQL